MNWTAILALLATNGFMTFIAWCGHDRADRARADAKDAIRRAEYAEEMKYAANSQAYENRREADHWKRLHDSLLKRQSRTGQRAGETDANGDLPAAQS